MATDTEILNWLLSRVSYMEHSAADGTPSAMQPVGKGFWNGDSRMVEPENDCAGLSLREYIEEQIAKESA